MVGNAVLHEIGSILIDIPEKTQTVTSAEDNRVGTDMDSVLKGASLILNASPLQRFFKEILICSLQFLKLYFFHIFFRLVACF